VGDDVQLRGNDEITVERAWIGRHRRWTPRIAVGHELREASHVQLTNIDTSTAEENRS
jgi:hypothetical protein